MDSHVGGVRKAARNILVDTNLQLKSLYDVPLVACRPSDVVPETVRLPVTEHPEPAPPRGLDSDLLDGTCR